MAAILRDPARRRRALIALQVVLVLTMIVFLTIEVASTWSHLRPRLSQLDALPVAIAALALTAYYLTFVVGWMLILRAFGLRISYREAIGAEMLSMLAKYVPGGVWTPAARVVACRRVGLPAGPVLASIGYEAGLSAIAGVLVFAVSVPFAPHVRLPIPFWALALFAAVLVVLLHPAIFGRVADRFLRRGGDEPIPRLPLGAAAGICAYYAATWLIGGVALLAMLRALAAVPFSATPYLGGASAVGAIVAVLVVFAPSGLGVREGAVYALLLGYVDGSTALVVVALNRLLITIVEAALFGLVALLRRLSGGGATTAAETGDAT